MPSSTPTASDAPSVKHHAEIAPIAAVDPRKLMGIIGLTGFALAVGAIVTGYRGTRRA
jgi:hypothetical protein